MRGARMAAHYIHGRLRVTRLPARYWEDDAVCRLTLVVRVPPEMEISTS